MACSSFLSGSFYLAPIFFFAHYFFSSALRRLLHAHRLDRRRGLGLPDVRHRPEHVVRGVTEGLLVGPDPARVAVALHVHGEAVDVRVVRVDDLQVDVGPLVGLHLHVPLELRLARLARVRVPVDVLHLQVFVALVVHADVLRARRVVPVPVARLHPVAVGQRRVQGLLVGEDVGAAVALPLHVEGVAVVVVRVVDVEGRLGGRVGADHDGHPHELGLRRRPALRVHRQVRHVQLALAVDVRAAVVVVAGVAAAVLVALAVVPAVVLQVGLAGEGLGLLAHPVLVDRHVEVRPRVLAAGGPNHVSCVADLADVVRGVHLLSEADKDLREVCVAAVVAVLVLDEDAVAVAAVASGVVVDVEDLALRHGRHRIPVVLAVPLSEVQGVAVVAVGAAVVLVAVVVLVLRVVGVRELPVLARREGQGQGGHPLAAFTIHAVVVLTALRGVFLAQVHVLVFVPAPHALGIAADREEAGADGHEDHPLLRTHLSILLKIARFLPSPGKFQSIGKSSKL